MEKDMMSMNVIPPECYEWEARCIREGREGLYECKGPYDDPWSYRVSFKHMLNGSVTSSAGVVWRPIKEYVRYVNVKCSGRHICMESRDSLVGANLELTFNRDNELVAARVIINND